MSLLRKLQILGQYSRAHVDVLNEGNPLIAAALQELNPRTTEAMVSHLSSEQISLLSKIEAEIKSDSKSPKNLVSMIEQADDLHLAVHGLLQIGEQVEGLNPASVQHLYDQFGKIVETVGSDLNFNALINGFCLSGRLVSNPLGCYLKMAGAPKPEEAEGITSVIVIQVGHPPRPSTEQKKPSLDTAPTHLPGSAGGFVMATHISKLQLDSSPRRGGLDKVQRQFQLILKLLERLPKLRN